MRFTKQIFLLVVLMLCFTITGCGSTPTGSDPYVLPKGAPPPPTPNDPWFGTAGNVLISAPETLTDGAPRFLWIGFNSYVNWQSFLNLHDRMPNNGWIGGHVVVDSKSPLGFYFDPNTTTSAEITAEGLQTSLGLISKDPSQYGQSGWSQSARTWYVIPVTELIQN